MSYIQLILDFGFILSATETVAQKKNSDKSLSVLFSTITIYKFLCGAILLFLIIFISKTVYIFKDSFILIIIYYIAYWINSLLPDYIYRGMEKMKNITIRTLFVKIFFTIMIFLFLKDKNDYYVIPIFLLIGNVISVCYSWFDIYKSFNIKFVRVRNDDFKDIILKSFPFFYSRIASTVYQATNLLILKKIYINSPVIGYYSSADKLVSLSKSLSSPIADSLYPYMVKNKDFKLIKKILMITMPFIVFGATILFIKAEDISILLFGEEFANAGGIIRCLVPIMVVILPSYILCFPTMNPLNLTKYANYSNVIGALTQIIILIILFVLGYLNIYTLCLSTSLTEIIVFLYRLFIIINRKKLLCNL